MKNKYVAKVIGSAPKPYDVVIKLEKDGIKSSCTCPCTCHCKHEYAVVLAIKNHEYEEIKLMTTYKEKEGDLKTLIEKIPADELKKYLLSPFGKKYVVFEMEAFSTYFRKYLPEQPYEYYYNNLYNELVLSEDAIDLVEEYLERVKQYIAGNNFYEVIKINQAIINAYKDTDKLNNSNQLIDKLPKIGMFLRVAFRKGNEEVKNKIINWTHELKQNNYYNNYYLEDIIISMK